jgi:hypothetical protein
MIESVGIDFTSIHITMVNQIQFQKFIMMQAKELDMLIIHMGMELNLHKTLCHFLVAQLQVELNLDKTLCHFLVAQLQDLEPNVSRKH